MLRNRSKAASTLAFVTAITACAGDPPLPPVALSSTEADTSHYSVGERAVFADLRQDKNGSWLLGKLSTDELSSAEAYRIRLNDLSPAFDTRVAQCAPQAYPSAHKCSPSHPFRDRKVGVVGKLISGGIAAGTAGKVTDISRTYETEFDIAEFNKAVDEALVNAGLSGKRETLLRLIDTFEARAAAAAEELTAVRSRSIDRYRVAATGDNVIDLRVDGLTEYYSHDIDANEVVIIEPLKGPRLPDSFDAPAHPLPCQAAECIAKTERAIAALDATLDKQHAAVAAADGGESGVYSVDCSTERHRGYWITAECPDTVTRSDLAAGELPVRITIRARDFDALYPQFELADERLAARISGDTIRLTNKTTSFITVVAQTLYYNSQLETLTGDIDIAPGATLEQPLAALASPAIEIEAHHAGLTPDKAARASVQVGYAVQYLAGGDERTRSLFDKRAFNVACMVQNALRPGQCRHRASFAASDSRGSAENLRPVDR